MTCSNCGKEIPDGVTFCPFCGKKCAKKLCTVCGAELKEGQLFCHECGLRVDGEAPKDTDTKKTLNIVCTILSVFSLLFAVVCMVEYCDDEMPVMFIELVYIVYIRYKYVHKDGDMTITGAVISTVLTVVTLIVVVYYFWYWCLS